MGEPKMRAAIDREDDVVDANADFASAIDTRSALMIALAALVGDEVLMPLEKHQAATTIYCLLAQRGCMEAEDERLTSVCDLVMFG